jgi:tetratricopeptide (TPR) repeat protein
VLAWYLDQTEHMKRALTIRRTNLEEFVQGDLELVEQARTDPAALQGALVQMALRWFEAERPSLVGVQRQAAEVGEHETVWRLAAGLTEFFDQREHWGDWQATHKRALLAARESGDRKGEGQALRSLGSVHSDQGRFAEGVDYQEQALAIFRELGDRYGEGLALITFGGILAQQGRFAEAVDLLEQSLAICQEFGDREDEGQALNALGEIYVAQGARDRAKQRFAQALAIFQELEAPEAEQVAATLAELRRPRGLRSLFTGGRRR